MLKSSFLIILFITGITTSTIAQEIQIFVNNNEDIELKIISISNNDNVILQEIKQNSYSLKKEIPRAILIKLKHKNYRIDNIDKETKSIIIDYEEYADDQCYVVHKIYGDVVQTSNINDFRKCSSLTNIYIYNEYKKDNIIEPDIKLRIKN